MRVMRARRVTSPSLVKTVKRASSAKTGSSARMATMGKLAEKAASVESA
jgi:hypothetical protein